MKKGMKGRVSKLLSVVVTLAMAFSCFTPFAFAGDGDTVDTGQEGSKTLETVNGRTFELYQIFTGDASTSTDSASSTNTTVLSNLKWGYSVKDEVGITGDEVSSEIKTAINTASGEAALASLLGSYIDFDKIYNASSSYTGELSYSGSGTTYTYTGLAAGYYLAKDKADTQSNGFYTLYAVGSTTNGTLTFQTKGSTPAVEKKVEKTDTTTTADITGADYTTASIGETLYFTLNGSVSSQIDSFKTYFYKFTDNISKGLTANEDSIKVYVNGVDATKYFYRNVSQTDGEAGTITVSIKDLKLLKNVTVTDADTNEATYPYAINGDTHIVVKYSATLNEHAQLNSGNSNTVSLVFSNDPNNSGEGAGSGTPPEDPEEEPIPDNPSGTTPPTGESPSDTVNVYTTALKITKINNNNEILTGAEFTLTPKDGNTHVVVVTLKDVYTKVEGNAPADTTVYYKLNDETYTTTSPTTEGVDTSSYADPSGAIYYTKTIEPEVTTKDGATVVGTAEVDSNGVVTFFGLGAGTYTLKESKTPAGYNTMAEKEFTIRWDSTNGKFACDNWTELSEANGVLNATIVNQPGSALPTTGGIGTTIFYAVGSVLVVGACIALVLRRRKAGAAQ